MTIEDASDLEGLAEIGRVVASAREAMLAATAPGVTTGALDAVGRDILNKHGARSAPQLIYNFPGYTCVSVNNEAAHGIPSNKRILRDGDIVNVDISAELNGFFADTGASAAVGKVSPAIEKLLTASRATQAEAMKAARAGSSLLQVVEAVQRQAEASGFSVLEDLMGHGIGRSLHEYPDVPSAFITDEFSILEEGMVIAVEPFLSFGATHTVPASDGWTLLTNNGGLAAQFEHTMVVTTGDPIVLTAAA